MICDVCGAETSRRFYYPTKVARVTHNIGHGLWVCPHCSKLMQHIEWYESQGFSFFPLKPKSKRPNLPKWEPYQQRKPSPQEVDEWLKNGKFGGIAICTGAVSGNLVAFDFDSREAYFKAFTKSNELQQQTFVVETARGFHVYVRSKNLPGRTEKFSSLKFDYKAEGAYIVAPPSNHPSGHVYRNVGVFKVMEATDVQNVKNRIISILGGHPYQKDLPVTSTSGVLTRDYPCWEKLSRGVFEGDRDEAAFLLALHLRDKGLAKPVVRTILKEWWKKLEQPPEAEEPFTLKELERKVDQAFKEKRYLAGCATIRRRWPSLCSPKCPLQKRKPRVPEILAKLESMGASEEILKATRSAFGR